MTGGPLKAGERETRVPEPNTLEAARALRDELNRAEPPRGYTRWVTGGMSPDLVVYRVRRWMPEDVEAAAPEVEAEYLAWMREVLPGIHPHAIVWRSIEICGAAPDSRFEAVFSPLRVPEHQYGWRWRIWPLDAPTVESALDYADISLEEWFSDGIGADARFGRIPAKPGEVRWLNLEA